MIESFQFFDGNLAVPLKPLPFLEKLIIFYIENIVIKSKINLSKGKVLKETVGFLN